MVLGLAVATDNHGKLWGTGFDGPEFAFESGEGDGFGVEFEVALVIDGDGLHLGALEFGGLAGFGEIDLNALDASGGHDDEDEEEHEIQVHHWGDIDVVVALIVAGLHGMV